MKNVVFASILGTLAGAFAIPRIGGPVHYQLTRPYSFFGYIPPAGNGPSSVTLGTTPLDFVLTDVMVCRENFREVLVLVNGTPAMNVGSGAYNAMTEGNCHMTTGIFIPAGSTVSVRAADPGVSGAIQAPVTLAGYVQ